VGHDWGARAAYTLAVLFSERITTVSALALAYQSRGLFKIPSFDQAKALGGDRPGNTLPILIDAVASLEGGLAYFRSRQD
jgi:pimeloyl-ACP methyl ester carboxylesterase